MLGHLLNRSQNSLMYKGINFFNSMPRQVKRAATMAEFKKKMYFTRKINFVDKMQR